jgi:hypothetical protein
MPGRYADLTMFHIQPNKSPNFDAKTFDFLYQDGELFVMDNHTLAAWCWGQVIDFNSKYTLLHIDQHYDLIDDEDCIKSMLSNRNIDISLLSIKEFLSLEKKMMNGNPDSLFRFDSYINNFALIHKGIITKGIFLTHDIDSKNDKHIHISAHDFRSVNFQKIENQLSGKIILNLDIDYFFSDEAPNPDKVYQLPYSQIDEICQLINNIKSDIEVFTIALTPSFCGGLDSATKILDEILSKTRYSKFSYE